MIVRGRQKLPGKFDLGGKIVPTFFRQKYFGSRDGFSSAFRLTAMTEDEPGQAGSAAEGIAMTMIVSLSNQPASVRAGSDDEGLLDRMRADDTEAYRELVERHIDRAYALALRILRSAADAEDVTQDAFIKTWQNRHAWQSGKAKFSTWLYRVIVNRCIDLKRAPRGQWIEQVPEPADDKEDAPTTIHKRQVFGQLDRALARLPAQQRTALALSYYEEMSNGAIAQVMGTSIGAVESLLKRGRQRLRELLKRSERDVRIVLAQH